MPAHKRRPDGRLKAAVKIGVKPDGAPRYKYVFGTSERELQRKIEEVRLSVKTGTLHTSDKITVEQLLQIWMERHIAKKEPNTQEFYRHRVRDIVAVIGAVKVKDLSPLHVEALLDKYREKVSGTTLHHTFCTLKAAINRGIRSRLAPAENPCKGVDAPKRSTKRPEPFTITEVERLLAAAQKSLIYPLVFTAIWTGLREGELLGLQWSDIDFERKWLLMSRSLRKCQGGAPVFGPPKTENSKREVPLSGALIEVLKEHRSRQQVEFRLEAGSDWKDYNLVFTQRNGGPMNPSNLRNRYWYPLLEKAGLRKLHIHDCRHAFATLMISDSGCDLKTVQSLLVHADMRTTGELYTHTRDCRKQEAVNQLDALLAAHEQKRKTRNRNGRET